MNDALHPLENKIVTKNCMAIARTCMGISKISILTHFTRNLKSSDEWAVQILRRFQRGSGSYKNSAATRWQRELYIVDNHIVIWCQ